MERVLVEQCTEVRDGHVMAVDGIGGTVARASREMRDELVTEQVPVDPMGVVTPLLAPQDAAVELPCSIEIVDGDRQVESGQGHDRNPMCQAGDVPRFEPFAALRYASDQDLDLVIAPPYDVLSDADTDELAARDAANIVHVDVPRERDGPDRYEVAGSTLRRWIADGILVADAAPTFTIYRMAFDDEEGGRRVVTGVLGAIEVTDSGVLPHERTTPKASTDRLDLTRAANANLSPVWGLSLAPGLTALLAAPGDEVGSIVVDGATHSVERVDDPERLAAIAALVGSDDVLIADGHHRYGVARQHRDDVRTATGRDNTPAELTLAFVNELIDDQLSVAPIHRLYTGIEAGELRAALDRSFLLSDVDGGAAEVVTLAAAEGRMAVVWSDGTAHWLDERPEVFDDVRALDGLWLEHTLADVTHVVTYQHGAQAAADAATQGDTIAAVLIRPVSVAEITRTAREGLLMPPKSTFFTPKLRTGFVIRSLE